MTAQQLRSAQISNKLSHENRTPILNTIPILNSNSSVLSLDGIDSRKKHFIDSINNKALKLRYIRITKSSSKGVSELAMEDRVKSLMKTRVEDGELDNKSTCTKNPDNAKQEKPVLHFRSSQENIGSQSTEGYEKPKKLHKQTHKTPTKRKIAKKHFIKKSEMFHRHIMKVAYNNRKKARQEKRRMLLTERETNLNLFQKVAILRYRDNVFRAASKLSKNITPFPSWSYKNKEEASLNKITINVGGTYFEVFDKTLMNLPHTKLSDSFLFQCKDSYMFFDRDSLCFNSILNFYRTGKLHAPANSCLSFFEEELMFWGLNEDFMEPCCISDYQANRKICHTLDNYMESVKPPLKEFGKQSYYSRAQTACNLIALSENSGLFSRWYTFIYGMGLVTSILNLIFCTTKLGRVDKITKKITDYHPGESIINYFKRTVPTPLISIIDKLLNGFFILDFIIRFLLFPDKLLFWADFLNWTDILVITSSVLSYLPMIKEIGENEIYPLILKVPRFFRIFRLSKHLRFGMDAFILTLRGSTAELLIVFIITIVAICFFGVTIYVVELNNELPERFSEFKSIFDGMWWAACTIATVGYGDYVPRSTYGCIVGYFCILTGIIITQLPVPIFLKNFSLYYNQIEARMKLVNTIINNNIDPETLDMPEPLSSLSIESIPSIKNLKA